MNKKRFPFQNATFWGPKSRKLRYHMTRFFIHENHPKEWQGAGPPPAVHPPFFESKLPRLEPRFMVPPGLPTKGRKFSLCGC